MRIRIPDAWLPRSFVVLRGYPLQSFVHDLIAGLTVGLVALPLAMAFAIASGVAPESGIYCAIVAGFLISALGGSRVQIGGPTGAFVVVVSGIVARHGVDGLFMCTMMAGVLLIVLGATGMGTAVRMIPRPVVVGFTNGISVLIASTQVKDFFGLQIEHPSGVFLPRIIQLVQAMPTVNPTAAALGLASLLVMLTCARWARRVPGAILAMVLGTGATMALGLVVETIGTRFGGIPQGLPPLRIPTFRPEMIHPLLPSALAVAMLGAIESLMSAVVADRMTGDRHNPNVELIAQGVANVASPLVGGLPATGAIARTATNVRAGARTPVAGMIHAVTLLVIVLAAAPFARHVPLTVLSAILFVVAWNMGDWAEVPELLRLSKTDISVWVVTFALTVLADLTIAVEAGMILAGLLFIRKVASTTTVSEIDEEALEEAHIHTLKGRAIPRDTVVFRIHGPFLFGSTEKIETILTRIVDLPAIVILRLRDMTALDATGLQAIEDLADALHASGRGLILCGAREQPSRLMEQAEFHRHVGRENICGNIEEALRRARAMHAMRPAPTAAGD